MYLYPQSHHKIKLEELIFETTNININDPERQDHFVSKEYNRIFDPENRNQFFDNITYFSHFLSQLNKIKIYNQKDFREYLKKLSKDGENLVGERFEIFTYARLIDQCIPFNKPKHQPDFQFNIDGSIVYIECGSRQTDKKGFYIESIQQAIEKKQTQGSKNNYSNVNTALHIDITRTIYNSYGEDDFLHNHTLKNILEEYIKKVDFGAIVLLYTFYGKEDGNVYSCPIIEYNENCNCKLKELHDRMFKLEQKRITPILKKHI